MTRTRQFLVPAVCTALGLMAFIWGDWPVTAEVFSGALLALLWIAAIQDRREQS